MNENYQKARLQEIVARTRLELEERGTINPKFQKRNYVEGLIWNEFCVVCGKENPPGMARVCGSDCFRKDPVKI